MGLRVLAHGSEAKVYVCSGVLPLRMSVRSRKQLCVGAKVAVHSTGVDRERAVGRGGGTERSGERGRGPALVSLRPSECRGVGSRLKNMYTPVVTKALKKNKE